jgi:hypothetical protein
MNVNTSGSKLVSNTCVMQQKLKEKKKTVELGAILKLILEIELQQNYKI